MYKDYILKIAEFTSVKKVVERYGRSGKLFTYRNTDNFIELIFNRNSSNSITFVKFDEKALEYAPLFYLDDDNIFLNINDIYKLVLIDRFESFIADNNKVKYVYLLKNDLAVLNSCFTYIYPHSVNNDIKTRNRIRIVKTWYWDTKTKGKEYYANFGDSLWDNNLPSSDEDIFKYSKMFNNPINVIKAAEGIYCCNTPGTDKYLGVGLNLGAETITSIFPVKSNLPERLRQHYTSNFLEPKFFNNDPLMKDLKNNEKISAVCVFVPIASKYNHPFGDRESPVYSNTLIAGELLINEELAKKKVYIRRTAVTSSKDVILVEEGSIVNHGDVLAYNYEGVADVIYDLKYPNAVIEKIVEGHSSYKIILKIESEIGVARLISDYGLKGVTHPRKELGFVSLPQPYNEYEIPVEMVVGPNSMKSGSNGIRLSWLALKYAMDNKEINLNPNEITEEFINSETSDLCKGKWEYQGKTYDVYVGLVSFGVTDLALDCRSDYVRVMPETLKYMYLSNNQHAVKAADILIKEYVDHEDKWVLEQFVKLRHGFYDKNDVVWDLNDERLKANLASLYFNINSWSSTSKYVPNLLTNPFNSGFVIKVDDVIVRFPSARLINYQAEMLNNSINYPLYLPYASLILLSIKLYHAGKCDKKAILKNIEKYLEKLDAYLYEKRGVIAKVCSPNVTGGNLKQIVSSHVPPGVTVIVDGYLEKQIFQFSNEYKNQLFEIGVRNPVLWDFQFRPKKVWTLNRFERHLAKKNIDIKDVVLVDRSVGSVLRNSVDVMYDQSDTDGDLYPVCVPLNAEFQDAVYQYSKNLKTLPEYKQQWIESYMEGECDNSKFTDVENKPFQYYTVSREWFAGAFAKSAIAKIDVGMATVELWRFHTAVEMKMNLNELDSSLADRLMFTYSRIVQDRVIRGIKHTTNGSSDYEMYSGNDLDENIIMNDLITEHGLNIAQARTFIEILKYGLGSKDVRLISRITNGGTHSAISNLKDSFSEIDERLYNNVSYLKILKPYFKQIFPYTSILTEGMSMQLN